MAESYHLADTIYALASGHGAAGVAVIRVSGNRAWEIARALSGLKKIQPRHAYVAPLRHNGQELDKAVLLCFKAPRSFTGEDVAEFHVHGGRAVVQAVSDAIADTGARPAERGEFSRRAVVNGKMDLTQAEGLMDLIGAQTEKQRAQALSQLDGRLAALYDGWRDRLVRHMAYLEAFIDFPDEDIPPEKLRRIDADLAELAGEVARYLNDNKAGEKLRTGFQIAIVGAPNVGKSSLINALTRREVAIVSQTAGTTRDIVEAHLDVDGFPVILADTAGLRETRAEIESEGIRRAVRRAEEADLVLHVLDASDNGAADKIAIKNSRVIRVWNKIDRIAGKPPEGLAVSAKTGKGIAALWEAVKSVLHADFASSTGITRDRYRVALEEAHRALANAVRVSELELKAEELRLAARALGRITGRIDADELLDVIFRDFCIGK
ncbi:MAG: tRNA uridine-5-carboxymethylaminomethyl(34) synthesis GTPase MnmE [Alphaproteobacteria bacterium]|nr:tRNA uridine-5-carboxymethylaminomethyl(34) synthesis GTPase MnmE [Alphaproteobacteria bacterium]